MSSPHPTADALTDRGLTLLKAGASAEAANVFRAAIAADARHVEAHRGLVRALHDAGRLEQSIGAALALTVLLPHDPQAHTVLAAALRAAGHIPQAEAAETRARVLQWKLELQSAPNPAPDAEP